MRPRVIILSVLLAALTASLVCAAGAACISLERIGEESAGAVSAAAVGIGVFTFLQTTSRNNLYDMDSRQVKNEEHQNNLTLEREHPIAKNHTQAKEE